MSSRGSSSSAGRGDIGRYKIGKEIGKGSFANVYLGTHKESGAAVAIKSVDLARLNKKLRVNLQLEIKILKRLRHPHIVALHDCIETDTHIHLMMEYCELGDLAMFIKGRDKLLTGPATHEMARKYPCPVGGGLNEVVTRHFLKQLASALKFLRDAKLVHRDVKPQNLLLLPSVAYRNARTTSRQILSASHDSFSPVAGLASLPMLKLGDFGFARVLPSTSLAETLCGSPLYMAPEILRYEKYDATVDLWSVGTVLHEMVTGKPPFRAGHHMELLRIIEASQDQIRFSRSYPISTEMKALIRSLLKRLADDRLTFDEFFANEIIVNEIPGLVEDDVPPPESKRELQATSAEIAALDEPPSTTRRPSVRRQPSERQRTYSSTASRDAVARSPLGSPSESDKRLSHEVPNTGYSPRSDTREGLGIRPGTQRTSTSAPTRPMLVDSHRRATTNVSHLRSTRDVPSPSSLGEADRLRSKVASEKKNVDERERAAQEVAFERDYVVVDKDQVAVNALADELSRNHGRDRTTSPKSGQLVRRGTQGASDNPAARGMQITQSRQRPGTGDHRSSLGSSPGSATSFISKAIQDASLRLLGIKYPQMPGKGTSPPHLQNNYPLYPVAAVPVGLIGDGKQNAPLDEDARVAQAIEDYANQGDVVYYFAEVKYQQLVPLAPSRDRNLAGQSLENAGSDEQGGLTIDAIVSLSEEALVLFVKALSLLARSMEIAGMWWARRNRNESSPSPSTSATSRDPSTTHVMSTRINSAVQWIRSRFNEVLEKVEIVRLKLLEAQKQLPEDHPSHPSNNHVDSQSTGANSREDIILSAGVSAEKLMYDRAVEMSRTAAINEVANEDLAGCEISYVTAIRMLEAVLDGDDDVSKRRSAVMKRDDAVNAPEDTASELAADDQQTVQKLIALITTRLGIIRKKMAMIATASKQSRSHQSFPQRRSGDASPRSIPSS